ncbi:MAG: DUF5615 family PIN-like protein [Gemmataceae bacterium]|nr:DUF5615 family PIN-like protein [Gemmataceae bacterium]
MARLLADEDFPGPTVEELRRLGHDVVTVRDPGRADREFPDPEVLASGTADGRAVLTRNRWDYVPLHGRNPVHAGIIACTHDPDYLGLAARIDAAVRAAGSLQGQLIRVNRPPRQP